MMAECETGSNTTCFVVGYLAVNSAIARLAEGLFTVLVTKRIFFEPAKADDTVESKAVHSTSAPAVCAAFKRSTSYKPRIEACSTALTPPLKIGDSGLPSILIERPS